MKPTFPKLPEIHHAPIIPSGLATIANMRDALSTIEAAAVLTRAPQTLRKWACLENGPLRPIRINGRLAWKVADLARLLTEDPV